MNSKTGFVLLLIIAIIGFIATKKVSGSVDEAIANMGTERATEAATEGAATKGTAQSGEQSAQARKTTKGKKLEMAAALKGTPERIIEHFAYTVSFNRETNAPNYVAWELTEDEADGSIRRSDEFFPDPDVPLPHRVTTDDYRGSGYDRGHMAPAADMRWSQTAMRECFYMSNMCPQNHTLNAGAWAKLEGACRRWAKKEGSVYIACGPVYKQTRRRTIGREHPVRVPDGFFKVVMSLRKGSEKAIGFYYANDDQNQNMSAAAMSVDDVEALTGMNFFVGVDAKTEKRIEATYKLRDWQ